MAGPLCGLQGEGTDITYDATKSHFVYHAIMFYNALVRMIAVANTEPNIGIVIS